MHWEIHTANSKAAHQLTGGSMPDMQEHAPPLPWLFFIVAIVAAAATGAAIVYLGMTGHLGGGIPGSRSSGSGLLTFPGVVLHAMRGVSPMQGPNR